MEWRILAGLEVEERGRVLAAARRRTFGRGEVVFHRGDPADSLHFVVKGRFAARVTTPVGDTAVLAVVGRGDVFGELALFEDGALRSATVAALEEAETRSLHRVDFDALWQRDPAVLRALTLALATDVRRLSERVVEALYVPAEVRVLRRVFELTAAYGGGDEAAVVPLTQEELAGLAGTSRATVNRVLREAQSRGEVELRRGRTVVIRPDELARRGRVDRS